MFASVAKAGGWGRKTELPSS